MAPKNHVAIDSCGGGDAVHLDGVVHQPGADRNPSRCGRISIEVRRDSREMRAPRRGEGMITPDENFRNFSVAAFRPA